MPRIGLANVFWPRGVKKIVDLKHKITNAIGWRDSAYLVTRKARVSLYRCYHQPQNLIILNGFDECPERRQHIFLTR